MKSKLLLPVCSVVISAVVVVGVSVWQPILLQARCLTWLVS
jgi:hypothetical protein